MFQGDLRYKLPVGASDLGSLTVIPEKDVQDHIIVAWVEVMAMRLPLASLEDVLTQKLLALTEQEPDFAHELEVARSLREQIDWEEVRRRTNDSPFAKAFFTLVEELGIVEPAR